MFGGGGVNAIENIIEKLIETNGLRTKILEHKDRVI
jgi:hypothetical protein